MTTATTAREIVLDRISKDYDCYLFGEYIGTRSTYTHAERLLDEAEANTVNVVPAPRMTPAEPRIDADPMDAYADAYDASVTLATIATAGPALDFDTFFARPQASTPQGPPPPLPPLVAVGGDDPHLPPTVIDPRDVRRGLNNPLLTPGVRVALQLLTPAQFGRQVLAHAVLTGQLPSAIERRWIRLTTPQPWDVVKCGTQYGGCYGGEVVLYETDRARCEAALIAMHRARFAPFLPPAAAQGRAA